MPSQQAVPVIAQSNFGQGRIATRLQRASGSLKTRRLDRLTGLETPGLRIRHREAIAIAEQQRALLYPLQAATVRARLCQRESRADGPTRYFGRSMGDSLKASTIRIWCEHRHWSDGRG
jgi:hypothetical protein